MNGLKSAGVPYRQILGWIWLGLGFLAIVYGAAGLISIRRQGGVGFDLLPAFLLFVYLPFSLFMILTGYTTLARRRPARSLIIILSSLLIVIGGAFLLSRTLMIFRYVPTPLLLALGFYGIFVSRALTMIEVSGTQGSDFH